MVNLGIFGAGYIGRVHLAAAQKVPEARVVAVATSRPAETRRDFPELRTYPTYQELLRHEQLDAVIVCLPTFRHEEAVLAAAERGCHVLCEKALAMDADSAQRMLAAVRGRGRILMAAQVLRFWPQYARIKELLDAGEIGSLRSVTASRLSKYPPWNDWFRDPAKSGGCLLDLQVQDVDFVHWILGHPQSVYTAGIRMPSGSWDHVHTILNYPQSQANIQASYLMPESWPFTTSLHIVGTGGALEYTFRVGANIQECDAASHFFRWYRKDGTVSEPPVPDEDMFVAQLRYFVRCVGENQAPLLCLPEESCQVMQVMTASRQSANLGQPVKL
jgi:predicted dehydrogenase